MAPSSQSPAPLGLNDLVPVAACLCGECEQLKALRSTALERFTAWADWQGAEPCAELVRLVDPAQVRVPIGGGWSYWQETDTGEWTEVA